MLVVFLCGCWEAGCITILFYFFANIQFKFHVKKIEFAIERNENIIIFKKFFSYCENKLNFSIIEYK